MTTLQEQYINELLDPRSAKSPRENAAADEIRRLRKLLGIDKAPEPESKPTAHSAPQKKRE
jgi:hypothetical protein